MKGHLRGRQTPAQHTETPRGEGESQEDPRKGAEPRGNLCETSRGAETLTWATCKILTWTTETSRGGGDTGGGCVCDTQEDDTPENLAAP